MILYCTTCCAKKLTNPQPLPSIARYVSERIKRIYQKSLDEGVGFGILSGKYGLLHPLEPIPYYNKVLLMEEFPLISPMVKAQLIELKVSRVVFFAKDYKKYPDWEAYYLSLYLPCMLLGIAFTFAEVNDSGELLP